MLAIYSCPNVWTNWLTLFRKPTGSVGVTFSKKLIF